VTDIENRLLSVLLVLNQVRFELTRQLLTFDVTLIVVLFDEPDGVHSLLGETLNVTGPARCVTVIVLVDIPGAVILIVPLRALGALFRLT